MPTQPKSGSAIDIQPITPEELRRRASGSARQALPGSTAHLKHTGELAVSSTAQLGELVRAARERLDLNQQQLADLAGVGRRFLSELENGKPTSEFGLVLRVCRAVGIDVIARSRHR